MWNNENITFGYDTKPKVERLGFLSQSESFGNCNSQMSFLNDDTYSFQPFDNDLPLVNDDDSNSAVCYSEIGGDMVDQNDEQFPSISEDNQEDFNLLEVKNSINDVKMETLTSLNPMRLLMLK